LRQTRIRFCTPEQAHVRLVVYDALGRKVATLVDEQQSAESHRVRFEARDLPGGVYIARLRAGARTATQTLTVVR
jgi:hypothetical protein